MVNKLTKYAAVGILLLMMVQLTSWMFYDLLNDLVRGWLAGAGIISTGWQTFTILIVTAGLLIALGFSLPKILKKVFGG